MLAKRGGGQLEDGDFVADRDAARNGHLAEHHVDKVEDVVKVGDEIMVKVIEIDDRGRINLSRKEAIRELTQQQREVAGAGSGGP